MQDYFDGIISEETLHTVHQLLMEASADLGGILKFPRKLFRYLQDDLNFKYCF
jgi:hypothetical protein